MERDAAANLSEEENELFKEFFESHGLSRINYMRLLRAGQWVDTPPDGHLTREGSPNPRVRLMTKGEARVHVGDDEVSVCGVGRQETIEIGKRTNNSEEMINIFWNLNEYTYMCPLPSSPLPPPRCLRCRPVTSSEKWVYTPASTRIAPPCRRRRCAPQGTVAASSGRVVRHQRGSSEGVIGGGSPGGKMRQHRHCNT